MKREMGDATSVRTVRAAGSGLMLLCLALTCQAQQPDLTDRSLEDLMNIRVTSVSKTEQTLAHTAAAIFVITTEDIRRSGATNLPDLLRMVPGMDVAQINAHTWAISARGLSDDFSNELLVLLDGRNLYTPTFGGVLWSILDLPLENIERIEVIRGPGGSVWGANAVNGVVNIITKKADQTQGALVSGGWGNLNQGFGTAQYGGRLGKNTAYRVWTKYFNQNDLPNLIGQDGSDAWHMLRGGFRTDSTLSSKDSLMFQGDILTGKQGNAYFVLPSVSSPSLLSVTANSGESGGFLQSVWSHTYSARSDTALAVSYTTYEVDHVLDTLTEGRATYSVDFQHHLALGNRHDFVWGLGYRYSWSHSAGDLRFSLDPAKLGIQEFSGFVQDEIALVPNRLYLTVGTKLEHSHYGGFNAMPSGRVAWSLAPRHTLWAAISDADRTPSSLDSSSRLNSPGPPAPGGIPSLISIFGNPHSKDEGLIAYEAGYRTTVSSFLSLDLDAYYNDYRSQQTTEPLTPFLESTPLLPHLVIPFTLENLGYGEAHGFEIAANWKVTNRWTLSPAYDFERIHMHVRGTSQDSGTIPETEGSDPHLHGRLRSHVALPHSLSWDASAVFVDRLLELQVPSYTRLDMGLSWQLREGLSLALVGQNLARDRHLEFADPSQGAGATLIKRSGYAKFTWQF